MIKVNYKYFSMVKQVLHIFQIVLRTYTLESVSSLFVVFDEI